MAIQTAETLIKAALRRLSAYMSGEQLAATDANDCLECLNDLLDSWSTDQAYIYASPENVFNFTAGKRVYTIGQGGDFQVDAVTGAGVDRPLRITSAFTRISQLDFTIELTTEEIYNQILYKQQPGPWPVILWYNPTYPLGTLNFFPEPSGGGELHIFSDLILLQFASLTQRVSLPQGYARAIKWALAKEICAEYGFPISQAIAENAREAVSMIKSLNQQPVPVSKLDEVLSRGNQADASWILTGGFAQ